MSWTSWISWASNTARGMRCCRWCSSRARTRTVPCGSARSASCAAASRWGQAARQATARTPPSGSAANATDTSGGKVLRRAVSERTRGDGSAASLRQVPSSSSAQRSAAIMVSSHRWRSSCSARITRSHCSGVMFWCSAARIRRSQSGWARAASRASVDSALYIAYEDLSTSSDRSSFGVAALSESPLAQASITFSAGLGPWNSDSQAAARSSAVSRPASCAASSCRSLIRSTATSRTAHSSVVTPSRVSPSGAMVRNSGCPGRSPSTPARSQSAASRTRIHRRDAHPVWTRSTPSSPRIPVSDASRNH